MRTDVFKKYTEDLTKVSYIFCDNERIIWINRIKEGTFEIRESEDCFYYEDNNGMGYIICIDTVQHIAFCDRPINVNLPY